MSNLTVLFVHGGSAHTNLGDASAAYKNGEIEVDIQGDCMISDCDVAVGEAHACALADGGSVVKVLNPAFDAAGATTETHAVGSDLFAELADTDSAYDRSTNPYSGLAVAAGTGDDTLFLGKVERSANLTSKYIFVRPMRAEFAG